MMFRNAAWLLYALTAWMWLQPAELLHARDLPPGRDKHCLWKVQGKTNTVYLFGSIHFLKKDFYPLPAPIEEAYRQSQFSVFEADFTELESPQTQLKMLQMGQCPAGETLADQVSKETYQALTNYLRGAKMPLTAMDKLKPWMAAVVLVGVELQKLGFQPEQGVDKYFYSQARRDQKPVTGLETLEFQLSLFNRFTRAESEAMLQQTLAEISRFQTMLFELTAAWKNGDTQKIEGLMLDDILKYPRVYQKLMVDRNEQWSAQISAFLDQGKNAFIVVGAAHLAGQDSVVEMLRKKGYAIEQQ